MDIFAGIEGTPCFNKLDLVKDEFVIGHKLADTCNRKQYGK
jgi:hypothetical protein|tara:strand:+ start:116 stop:238 length:123 start_codon:yes stop_codon:yes gene_type:complete